MYKIEPVGFVENERNEIYDNNWGDVISKIKLTEKFSSDSLKGIEGFSHLEIIFYFHLLNENDISAGASHPRENPEWPETGIFAQRKKARPNMLGVTIVKLLNAEETVLTVAGLDAVNETPVIDIKPVVKEFLPKGEILQPVWVTQLMKDYFKGK